MYSNLNSHMETKTGLVECLILYVMPSEECKNSFSSKPGIWIPPPPFLAEDTSYCDSIHMKITINLILADWRLKNPARHENFPNLKAPESLSLED